MKIQSKKSNSRSYFNNNRGLLKYKRSQAELITTVLLILVSIAAVVLVSGFVINMVRDYLKPTDCFKTTDQLTISTENDYTFYNTTSQLLFVSIARGEKAFNLTAVSVVFGDGHTSKKIRIISGTVTGAQMYTGAGFVNNLLLPDTQESKYYSIDASSLGTTITKVSIAPSLLSGGDCKETDSKDIISKP